MYVLFSMRYFISTKVTINKCNNSKLCYPPKFYQRFMQVFFWNLVSYKKWLKRKVNILFNYLLLTLFSTLRNVKRMFIDHTFNEVKNRNQWNGSLQHYFCLPTTFQWSKMKNLFYITIIPDNYRYVLLNVLL